MRLREIGLVAAALLAVVAWGTPASSQSPSVYFGVHGGKSMASTELTDASPSTFSLDGLGSSGHVAGVHAGIDVRLPNSPIFAGILAGYDWQNTRFDITSGSSNFNVQMHDSWYAGARTGVIVHGGKVYVLAAYRQTEISTSVATLTLPNAKGWDIGVGAELPITKNISLGVEVVRTQFGRDEIQYGSPSSGTGAFAQTDQLQGMARLNFCISGCGGGSIFSNEDDPAPPKQRSPK